MIRRQLGYNGGALIFALVLVAVGGYYFLRNTLGFDLGELDGEAVWPIIVIAIGAWILYRNLGPREDGPRS
jgi:hypothetical protein